MRSQALPSEPTGDWGPEPPLWPGKEPPQPQHRPTPEAEREQRAALVRLALVVVAGLVVADLFGALATVLVVLALVVMILLHEAGHFIAAKRSGMKVSEFFFGFGPRLWSVKKGETTYGIKAFPLGGYCRIIGMTNAEEVAPEDEPRAYRNQATWKRLVVASAGSFVHFCLAFALLVVLFVGPGDMGNFVTNPPAGNPIAAVDGFANGKSPAQLAGIKPGDRILAVNGHHFATWDQMTSYLRARPDKNVKLTIESRGRVFTASVVLANGAKVHLSGSSTALYSKPTGLLGVEEGPVHFGFFGSVGHAATSFGSTVATSVTSIGRVVGNFSGYVKMLGSQKAADSPHAERFVSPVGVVVLAHEATQVGLSEVLYLLILINIFVGVFNMVPLLPMDGGHVAVALYEKVRSLGSRQPYHADVNKLAPVIYAVLALLLFYGISALFLDLRQVLS
jgi:membrane-associated protease RseP (regulator of RpoE activity)